MSRRAAPHRGVDVHYGDAGDGDDARPSKSALKRQSHALQTLGAQLAALSSERLAATPMPEPLREAIAEYRRTKSHEGRRRQMQYVGKLMRDADEAPLREAVAEARLGPARQALELHAAERWREALVAREEALGEWLQAHPSTDAQQLRSLVRAARRDHAAQPPAPPGLAQRQPRSWRDLYRFLKAELAEAAGPAAAADADDLQDDDPNDD